MLQGQKSLGSQAKYDRVGVSTGGPGENNAHIVKVELKTQEQLRNLDIQGDLGHILRDAAGYKQSNPKEGHGATMAKLWRQEPCACWLSRHDSRCSDA